MKALVFTGRYLNNIRCPWGFDKSANEPFAKLDGFEVKVISPGP
jgi:hypothetical protein